MKNRVRSGNIKKYLFALSVFFSCALIAESGKAQFLENGAASRKGDIYETAGKRDPFMPFIKLTESESEVKPQVNELLPPIQKYSLDEFKLVGVVLVGKEPRAMIIDPEKNTYVLGVGDGIGNRQGKIVEIKESGILVEEKRFLENIFGEKRVEFEKSVLAFKE